MPPLLMARPSGPITGPFGTCSSCGGQDVHLACFSGYILERRCGTCGVMMTSTPPKLDKKLIYLDQWALSEFANSLDPVLREKKDGRVDPFWRELYRDIDLAVKLHVAVCPESPVHERESMVNQYHGVLRALYGHLALGTRFHEPLQIHSSQLVRHFNKLVRGKEPTVRDVPSWVLSGRVQEWADDIRISARFPVRQEAVTSRIAENRMADDLFARDTESWRTHRGRSFSDWYDYHRRDLTGAVLDCYNRNVFGTYGIAGRSMMMGLVEDGRSPEEADRAVRDFLASDDATRVPFCELSSLLFAGLSQNVANGQKTPMDHGDWNDIEAIAAYLPYVDAICVDSYFATLLDHGEIKAPLKPYAAKVFSPRRKEEFQQYFRQLTNDASPYLRATVEAVYGQKWFRPYDTILEYHRERERAKESEA